MRFTLVTNAQEIADKLGILRDILAPRLEQEVQKLSVMAHADVVQHAQDKLKGSMLERFLGPRGENVRWERVGPKHWMVSIDKSVADIEEGAPKRFMEWLLRNNPKAKMSKKGTLYASIPMTNARWKGQGKSGVNRKNVAVRSLIEQEMKRQGLSLSGITKDSTGKPKLGVVARIDPEMPGPQRQYPGLYSMPRTYAMAQLTGLPEHGGIPFTQGTLIVQREGKKGKIVREAVTFRTITEAHEREGRWFAPAIPALNSLRAAYDKAQHRLTSEIIPALQKELAGGV